MFWPGGWSVRIALFILEWQCAMSNRWWCVQSLLIPRLGETLWCGGTWKQRAAARDPKWSLTIIEYYHPGAGGGGAEIQTGTQAGQRLGQGDEACAGAPVGGLYTPAPTTYWTLGSHSQRSVLFSKNAAFIYFFHATPNVDGHFAEGARCRGSFQSSAYLRWPQVNPLMNACMGKCFV